MRFICQESHNVWPTWTWTDGAGRTGRTWTDGTDVDGRDGRGRTTYGANMEPSLKWLDPLLGLRRRISDHWGSLVAFHMPVGVLAWRCTWITGSAQLNQRPAALRVFHMWHNNNLVVWWHNNNLLVWWHNNKMCGPQHIYIYIYIYSIV